MDSDADPLSCHHQEKWSDDEHARFVEAIDRFGRDWAKIVAHIGTRTVAQVRRLRLMASLSEAAELRASSRSAYRKSAEEGREAAC